MTLAAYSAAAFPATPVIWGVGLRPFALGHALVLARIGSPFMGGAKQADGLPGDGDLLTALAICARDPLTPPSKHAITALWVRNCWRGEAQWLAAKAAFLGYVQAACTTPETLEQPGGKAGRTSLFQALLLTLEMDLHQRHEDALRTPVSLAIAHAYEVWAGQRRVVLKTPEIAAALSAVDAFEALVKSGQLTAAGELAKARAADAARRERGSRG